MNKIFKLSTIATLAILSLTACKQNVTNNQASSPSTTSSLGTPDQQTSYVIGLDMGHNLKQLKDNGLKIDMALLTEGIQTIIDGKEPKVNDQQTQEIISNFMTKQQQKLEAKLATESKDNLEKGEAFLKENAKKEGVKTTSSGLQYIIKKEGTGAKPKADDIVTVEYEGRLIDGTVFDSSKMNGNQPATFPLNSVIPGWIEGVQLMKEGGEYTFYIPANLAYGNQSMGDKIGPNSTLIFDIHVLKVEKAPKK